MRITDLHGDSAVTDVTFHDGTAACRFVDGATDASYRVVIKTDRLFSQASSESGSVHVRIVQLAEKLPLEPVSRRYMLSGRFGDQMQAAREGWQLAVGLQADAWPLFLQIRGYQILLACPLQSLDAVTIHHLEEA